MGRRGNVISFINMKGGVGKTTLCKEVGTYLSEMLVDAETNESFKVLLVDIDPQSNLTTSLQERFDVESCVYEENDGEKKLVHKCSIDNIFKNDPVGLTREHVILKLSDNLDLIPGELETVFLQRQYNSGTPNKLMDYFKDNNLNEEYDFILLDCPPTYSVYTEMSFYASDFYIVPAVPDAYSVLGVDLLERVVKDIVHTQRHGIFQNFQPKNLGVIWTRVDLVNKPKQQDYIEGLKQADVIEENSIYIFNEQFVESNKLSTSNFKTMIMDRSDKKLDEMIWEICNEIIRRIEVIESESLVKES